MPWGWAITHVQVERTGQVNRLIHEHDLKLLGRSLQGHPGIDLSLGTDGPIQGGDIDRYRPMWGKASEGLFNPLGQGCAYSFSHREAMSQERKIPLCNAVLLDLEPTRTYANPASLTESVGSLLLGTACRFSRRMSRLFTVMVPVI